MFYVAMRMAGITYVPNGPLPANLEDLKKMRYYFNQFGLGVKTGIDLPQESAGMQTNPKIVGGLLLDEAIGQFDTYTPLQARPICFNDRQRRIQVAAESREKHSPARKRKTRSGH